MQGSVCYLFIYAFLNQDSQVLEDVAHTDCAVAILGDFLDPPWDSPEQPDLSTPCSEK